MKDLSYGKFENERKARTHRDPVALLSMNMRTKYGEKYGYCEFDKLYLDKPFIPNAAQKADFPTNAISKCGTFSKCGSGHCGSFQCPPTARKYMSVFQTLQVVPTFRLARMNGGPSTGSRCTPKINANYR